jgi:hypothetical protein
MNEQQPNQQLVAYSTTTDEAVLDKLTEGMLAALALQNLPELNESASLNVDGRTASAEALGITSFLFKNDADSIIVAADGRKIEAASHKRDNTPKFDG